MILTGNAIQKAWQDGEIIIDPFEPSQINPNSYNYRLVDTLIEIENSLGGSIVKSQIELREDGYELKPEHLYLGCTSERLGSRTYVTTLLGRSSLGRLGLFLNISADLGHIGAVSKWTLELKAVQPLRIYPNMLIGQVCFWTQFGPYRLYEGRYQGDSMPQMNRDERLYARMLFE